VIPISFSTSSTTTWIICFRWCNDKKGFREKISFTTSVLSFAYWVSFYRSTTHNLRPNSRPTTPNPSSPTTPNSVGRQRLSESRKSASMRIPSDRDTYKDTDQIPSKSKHLLKALLNMRKSKKDDTLYSYLDEYRILCIITKMPSENLPHKLLIGYCLFEQKFDCIILMWILLARNRVVVTHNGIGSMEREVGSTGGREWRKWWLGGGGMAESGESGGWEEEVWWWNSGSNSGSGFGNLGGGREIRGGEDGLEGPDGQLSIKWILMELVVVKGIFFSEVVKEFSHLVVPHLRIHGDELVSLYMRNVKKMVFAGDDYKKDEVELDGKIVKEEEDAVKRIKGEALREKDDPEAFIFPIGLEGQTSGREDMKKVDRGIPMINHTHAEAMRILTNVLCQVGVTTLIAKFLILDIPIDRDSPIVVGRGFLRMIGGIVNTPERLFSTFDGFCH
nr:hypothetical protein [Tanacetum cinerariifolium]